MGQKIAADRGLKADTTGDPKRTTAKQKVVLLQFMLGSIALYSPVISRQSIVTDALCLNDIWSRLRTHYGFRKTGALVLDLPTLCLTPGTPSESYEALWERFHAFITDNLLLTTDSIKHLGLTTVVSEELSPTLLNVAVVLWLKAIHPSLPNLVKQKYAPELRNKTIASLREEISESLDSLVAELCTENASVLRSYSNSSSYSNSKFRKPGSTQQRSTKYCALCEAHNRPSSYFLSECMFLPEADKKFIHGKCGSRTRLIEAGEEDDYEFNEPPTPARRAVSDNVKEQVRKVDVMKSPVLYAKYGEHTIPLTLDSGAEADLMKLSCAKKIGIKVHPTKATASQADGQSNLKIIGEVHCQLNRGSHTFTFNGLVAENLSDEVICGVPFQSINDVFARPSTKSIYIGEEVVPYDAEVIKGNPTQRGCKAVILRVPRQTVLLPEETLHIALPPQLHDEKVISIEPRYDSPSMNRSKYTTQWLKPQISEPEDGIIHIANSSDSPILIKRHEQIAVVRSVTEYDETTTYPADMMKSRGTEKPHLSIDYKSINVDPDKLLSEDQHGKFADLHLSIKKSLTVESLDAITEEVAH